MSTSAVFRPRARLMSQLGEQLIRDETIAVLELIKNAYDADAKNVKVSMENVENPESAVIKIEDDGDGMTLDIVKNYWMEPGTDHKEKKLKQMLEQKMTSKLNRLPMGEKGIGRFGVHKLGHKVTLITCSENGKEVFLSVDWSRFNSEEYLSDVTIDIIEREPTRLFVDGRTTGTLLIIENLKTSWTRGKVRDLQRAITSLNSPFDELDSFKVNLEVDNSEWLKGLITYNDVKEYALFHVTMKLEGDKILNYCYNFKPWSILDKLEKREHIDKSIAMRKERKITTTQKKTTKTFMPIDLSAFDIGPVDIELLSFDLDSSLMKFGEVTDTSGLRKYLKTNGGIYVYRDNMKVYFSEDGDWLELSAKRVNAPVDRISTNLVIGSVKIKRGESLGLHEKTNREGFIEDEAYERFKEAVLFAIDKFERDRALDKYLIRKYYGATSKSEPVIAEVASLRQRVEKKLSDDKLKKEIFSCLDNIERDYQHITDIYQKSSSIGLSMTVVLHEIDKVISELERVVATDETSLHIKKLVDRLGKLTSGYASVIKAKGFKKFNLKKAISQALFLVNFRLEAHDIQIEELYLTKTDDFWAKGNDNLIVSNLINIIDNAIWWLSYTNIENKKIYIDLTREISGYLSIVIADNGKGFTIPTEMVTKPFITDKTGGMGLGLHLVSEIMKQHNGEIYFPEFYDLELPLEYKHGAIIALAFKGEE